MQIDKSAFFILVTTMAASAAGGWFARDKLMLRSEAQNAPPPPSAEPVPPPSSAPAPSAQPPPVAAPACDDDEGEAPVCPVFPDPGDEGGCGRLAARRCADYRDNLKPKAARAAVECLKKLPPALLCDPIAINKCGHEALMDACPPPPAAGDAGASEVDETCETILASCKSSIPGPTLADCRQTLSGLNEAGRKKMLACTAKYCASKGLYGCEAR